MKALSACSRRRQALIRSFADVFNAVDQESAEGQTPRSLVRAARVSRPQSAIQVVEEHVQKHILDQLVAALQI